MTDRVLATLTIAHAGVPVGQTSLIKLPPTDQSAVPGALRDKLPPAPEFGVDGFEPLPGYDVIRETVLKGSASGANLGYLGPVADPASDRRGREALEALDRLIAELEFRDDVGNPISVDVIVFSEYAANPERSVVLSGIVHDAPVSV